MGGKSHSGESRRIFQNLIADLGPLPFGDSEREL